MRAAKTELAKRRTWLGVAGLGMLACSLAWAGAPGKRPATNVKEAAATSPQAASQSGLSGDSAVSGTSAPLAGTNIESPTTNQHVRGGQMPNGDYAVIAKVVVDYRDDEMSKARARGELVGPLPMRSQLGGVAGAGCSFSIECDDGNPCTIDTCNFTPGGLIGSGTCEYNPVPNGFNSVFGGGISQTCAGIGTCGCDDDNYCNGFETCQGAVCAVGSFRNVGLPCDTNSHCREPGVCNLNTGVCTTGGPGACATNDDCGILGTGTCTPGACDTNPQAPTCCADADTCLPEFATCSPDSDNPGDPCQTDQECRGNGRCNRCAELCKTAADCDDKSNCNGVETCTALKCYGGTPPNPNTCTTDANCPGGKCLGTCTRGLDPCGYGADCNEGHCAGGTKANKVCSTDVDCPGSYCATRCVGGANNGLDCGLCPGGVCEGNPAVCTAGTNAGRPCGTCPGTGATCGTGAVCYPGRCCSAINEPVCSQSRLGGTAPPAICTGNWYPGDDGQELITTLCGGNSADQSVQWGCPKYSSGFTQTNINTPPQRLVTVGPISDSTVTIPLPGGPGGPLNKLGDDYTLTNGSYIGLEVMRWVGGALTAADRILIEFYDASGIFIEDIVMPGQQTTDIGIIVVEFRPALTIPPSGYVVARVASNFTANTRFVWVSTNAAAVGASPTPNNPDSLWVNGGPAANFLSPNPGILAFELAGDKTALPGGACCNALSGECADGVLQWVCADQGDTFNGLNTLCARCNGGPQTGQACRKCVGGANNGLVCSSDAGCPGGSCDPNNAMCTGNVCSDTLQVCPPACTPPATCGPAQCVALAACASGACCDPATGNCSLTIPGSCTVPSTFQGYGTDCDADNTKDPAQQHCCPQPDLGLKCMGGPNNMQTCTTDANCRFCVAGPNAGTTCSVHTDCARCIGGTQYACTANLCVGGPNDGDACTAAADCNPCTTDVDCAGDGVCTGHCLGNCVTRNSGADNCADAQVHVITVPNPGDDAVTITITGNNSPASDTVENPDSCADALLPTIEPGWWESFSINNCAWVRIDYCCSTPVHEPVWAFIAEDCACNNTIGTTANPYHYGEATGFRGPPYCDEDNYWGSYGPLAAGTYYFPIYSALAGTHGDYQVHITVEACPTAACCLPGGICAHLEGEEGNQTDCDTLGGYFLAPPQRGTGQATCMPGTCVTGSCCVAPGDCRDQVSETDNTPMTLAICNEPAFLGTFVGGIRCAGGTCNGGLDDGESCKVDTDCAGTAIGRCAGTAAQLAQPNPCPICEHVGAATCDLEANAFVWRSDLSSLANPTRQCNDIMPSATGVLSEMCVLGHYIGFPGGVRTDDCEDMDSGVTDHFTVRLYAPDPTRYFPGAILGEWDTTHVPNPRGESRETTTWGAGAGFYDFQISLIPNSMGFPLYELQQGQIYFLEIANNTTGGMPECDFWMMDAAPGQGNSYAFLDGCGLTYTEDSVKLYTDIRAMSDPAWCLNVPYDPPPTPIRACCTGDPLNPCVELSIRDCVEILGNWQFGQLTCSGYVCPVEPNDICARAPYVHEGEYGFNMFGAVRDGAASEQCESLTGVTNMDGDIWYFYQPTAGGQAYISTCDCERGGDEVVAVYQKSGDPTTCPCPGDTGMTLLQCYDDGQPNYIYPTDGCPFGGSDVVLTVTSGNCYTVRVAMFRDAYPSRNNLRIALSPAKCGNNTVEPLGGEQCDGTATIAQGSLCPPADCSYNCLCPLTVCGKQCVGGAFDGLACNSLADCPLGGTACEGKLEALLGEQCDASAGVPGNAPCVDFNTTCRPPGDPDGECTCIPFCGNGHREGGEICDTPDNGICGVLGCTGLCRCNTVCGNGELEVGEQCDKGGTGGTPPPSDALCRTRCQADCTCPTPVCGNNYTETLSNNEECDGTDIAGESTCPGEACRPPGDPAGECTCVCANVEVPPNSIVWDPTSNPVPWPNVNPKATTRSLRFTMSGEVGAAKPEAIKITMVDLQHPKPANLAAQPPPNFTTYDTRLNGVCVGGTLNGHHCDTTADCTSPGTCTGSLAACTAVGETNGCARWVGKPGTFLENQDAGTQGGTYIAARLQCTPFYHDWKLEGLITVVGAEITPSSEYTAEVYGAACLGNEDTCTSVSAPVTMYTRRSGDAAPNFNPPSTTGQPDALDVTAVVNKLKNLPGALVKAIVQLQPNLPELNANVNALDIVAVVDAVRGLKYGFSGPCPCPSTVTCGGACGTGCPAPNLCIKTCTGGTNDGQPCINNTHCPSGGTCGTPLCRDKCGRCKP